MTDITHPTPAPAFPGSHPVAKLTGSDMEVGNFISGFSDNRQTGFEISRLLLRKVDGVSTGTIAQSSRATEGTATAPGYYSQDWGRKFLLNGGCAYVDLNHLEICIPEVLSAHDHVAATHAMFRIAAQAGRDADRDLPDGFRTELMANNSDGFGNSYGTHLNFLISRQLWEDLFHRRVQCLLLLASFQASSILLSGQGKVGVENGRPHVPYQISQRADFFEILNGPQTTFNRPIVNSRDEAHCGARHGSPSDRLARLHVIFYDNNLCHAAMLLKVGTLQIILAMLETGWLDLNFIVDRPVAAVTTFSHDPDLTAKVAMLNGDSWSALDLQCRFLEAARRFVASGRCGAAVPRAGEILDLWEDTLEQLRRRNFQALAPRLDWVLKRTLLEQAMRERGLSWGAPEIKYLDHLYSHLDPDRGLYWSMERSGFTQQLVTEERIRQLVSEPPEDTRAWTRAFFLRLTDPDLVEDVDWDRLEFRFPHLDHGRFHFRRLNLTLDDPLDHTSDRTRNRIPPSASLEQIVEALGGVEPSADRAVATSHPDNPRSKGIA